MDPRNAVLLVEWVRGMRAFDHQAVRMRQRYETIGGLRFRYWLENDFMRYGPFYG